MHVMPLDGVRSVDTDSEPLRRQVDPPVDCIRWAADHSNSKPTGTQYDTSTACNAIGSAVGVARTSSHISQSLSISAAALSDNSHSLLRTLSSLSSSRLSSSNCHLFSARNRPACIHRPPPHLMPSTATSPPTTMPTTSSANHPLPQPRSWSEALQQYQQQKHAILTLPHAPPRRYLPVTHPLHTDAIHTITGQYKRKPREESVRAAEEAAEQRRVDRLHHIPTRAYNIVSNESTAPQRRSRSAITSQPTLDTSNSAVDDGHVGRREYDIINNHVYYANSEQRLQAEEQLHLQRLRNHAAVKLQREQRDYNNITHQYYTHNDEKQQVDERINTAALQRKYFDSHHYDPVRAQHCDPRKETEWRRQKAEEEQKWAGRLGGGQTEVGELIRGGSH